MDSFFWFNTINLEWSILHVSIEGSQVMISKQKHLCLWKKDRDEMSHHAAFHLGLHCLPMYTLSVFTRVKPFRATCRNIIFRV